MSSKPLEKITEEDFVAYEEVRHGGLFNMLDPNARVLTGLDRDTYFGILSNYEALMEKFPAVRS